VLGAFDPDDIERAFAPRALRDAAEGSRILVTDVSSGRKDSWTWGFCQWLTPEAAPPILRFEGVDGLHGAFWKSENGADVVARLAALAKGRGTYSVHGDQREEFMVRGEFAKQGMGFFPHPWTATSKPAAVETVRRWFREGTLWLPPHERLRRELHAFEERITPAGAFTFGARGSGHDDYVALLITAAMAHESRHLYAVAPRVKVHVLSVEEEIRRDTNAHFEREAREIRQRHAETLEELREALMWED
jgi:hypothetical protein